MEYIVKIVLEALSDIQEITDWYEMRQHGLGQRFQEQTIMLKLKFKSHGVS